MSQLLDCCTQHGIVWDKYSCEFSWQMSVSQNDDRRHRNADNLTSFCVCVSMESFNKSMDEHISRECSISFLSPCKVLGVRPSSNRLASRHNQKKWSKNIPSSYFILHNKKRIELALALLSGDFVSHSAGSPESRSNGRPKKRQTCDLMKCDKCVNIRRAGAAPYARMGAITASLASRGVWWFGRILPAAPASR